MYTFLLSLARSALLAALPTEGMTIVVLMGRAERAGIATTLQDCGWNANTPAAIVIGAATAAAWRWTGTLGELGAAEVPNRGSEGSGTGAPGLLVIGQVVAVAGEIERLRNSRDDAAPVERHRGGR